ncbi:hypothetical protein ACFLTP_01115 [Chloroflexota bacterium]
MNRDLFDEILGGLAQKRPAPTMLFSLNNKPLLDKRLLDWVKFTKDRNPKTYCVIVNNGEMLDRFSLAKMVQSGLDRLIVSLNAHTKEAYRTINTKLDCDRVMKNILYLLSYHDMKEKV